MLTTTETRKRRGRPLGATNISPLLSNERAAFTCPEEVETYLRSVASEKGTTIAQVCRDLATAAANVPARRWNSALAQLESMADPHEGLRGASDSNERLYFTVTSPVSAFYRDLARVRGTNPSQVFRELFTAAIGIPFRRWNSALAELDQMAGK